MMVIASQLTGPIAAMSSSAVSRMRGAVATNSFSKNSRRREAEKPGHENEQDHVAESDHPR